MAFVFRGEERACAVCLCAFMFIYTHAHIYMYLSHVQTEQNSTLKVRDFVRDRDSSCVCVSVGTRAFLTDRKKLLDNVTCQSRGKKYTYLYVVST